MFQPFTNCQNSLDEIWRESCYFVYFIYKKISRILIFCQHINLIRAFGIRTVVFYLVILKQFDRLRPVFIL